MASQARPPVSRSVCAPGTQSRSSTWLLGAPCLRDLLHPITYDGVLPCALGRGWALGGAVEEGAPTTPTPPGAPGPHLWLSGAPARSDLALAVCRLRVGAWSLGHPPTPLGDSRLDGEVQESGEALFCRAPRGAEWEAPLSCLVVILLGRGEADP